MHFFSQLVYLDTPPQMKTGGITTVGSLAAYYLNNPAGALYLKNRFGGIEREYTLWKSMLSDSGGFADWKIGHISDDNGPGRTGFYGCAYFAPDGGCVAAFRGSEMLGDKYYRGDYENDLALSYKVPTPQQIRANSFWDGFPLEKAISISVTGHSLGGNLAAYGTVTAPKQIKERLTRCAAFNAPGFCEEFIGRYSGGITEAAEKITLYQNKFDPVSSMLENITAPVITASVCDPGEKEHATVADIFYPHSNFCFAVESDGEPVRDPQDEKSAFCRNVHKLTSLFQKLPKKVRKDIADAVLKALYAAPSPQKRKQFMLDAALKYISHSAEFLLPAHFESASVAYASVMPGADLADKDAYDLIAAGEGPEISALAQTLKLLTRMTNPFD